MGRKVPPQEIIDALVRNNGMIMYAAHELGCTRQTVYSAIERYPQVKQALIDCRENTKDKLESALMKRVDSGDTTAIIFALKTLAKDRGYVERQELTGADGSELVIKVVRDGDIDS